MAALPATPAKEYYGIFSNYECDLKSIRMNIINLKLKSECFGYQDNYSTFTDRTGASFTDILFIECVIQGVAPGSIFIFHNKTSPHFIYQFKLPKALKFNPNEGCMTYLTQIDGKWVE